MEDELTLSDVFWRRLRGLGVVDAAEGSTRVRGPVFTHSEECERELGEFAGRSWTPDELRLRESLRAEAAHVRRGLASPTAPAPPVSTVAAFGRRGAHGGRTVRPLAELSRSLQRGRELLRSRGRAHILGAFSELRLEGLDIGRLDAGLRGFAAVEVLHLSRNSFPALENLPPRARVVVAHGSGVRRVAVDTGGRERGPGSGIMMLGLAYNEIRSASDLGLGGGWASALRTLDLGYNRLESLGELLDALATLPCLRDLTLEGNPLCVAEPEYRRRVAAALPRLATLDGVEVGPARHTTPGDGHGPTALRVRVRAAKGVSRQWGAPEGSAAAAAAAAAAAEGDTAGAKKAKKKGTAAGDGGAARHESTEQASEEGVDEDGRRVLVETTTTTAVEARTDYFLCYRVPGPGDGGDEGVRRSAPVPWSEEMGLGVDDELEVSATGEWRDLFFAHGLDLALVRRDVQRTEVRTQVRRSVFPAATAADTTGDKAPGGGEKKGTKKKRNKTDAGGAQPQVTETESTESSSEERETALGSCRLDLAALVGDGGGGVEAASAALEAVDAWDPACERRVPASWALNESLVPRAPEGPPVVTKPGDSVPLPQPRVPALYGAGGADGAPGGAAVLCDVSVSLVRRPRGEQQD